MKAYSHILCIPVQALQAQLRPWQIEPDQPLSCTEMCWWSMRDCTATRCAYLCQVVRALAGQEDLCAFGDEVVQGY